MFKRRFIGKFCLSVCFFSLLTNPLFAAFNTQIMQEYVDCGETLSGQLLRSHEDQDDDSLSLGHMIHILPELFIDGFDGITYFADRFKKLGINSLLLGASNPQTEEFHICNNSNGELEVYCNDGRYWPRNHALPSESVGGLEAEARLLRQLHANGIRVFADAVVGHFGYFKMYQTIYFADKWYYPSELPKGVLRPDPGITQVDWDLLESLDDAQKIIDLQRNVFSQKRLYGLPGFNHKDPRVVKHLIDSYKQYIDRGYDGFRIDAALYCDFEFIVSFVSELTSYAERKYAKRIDFIIELLARGSFPFHVLSNHLLGMMPSKKNVYFLDFPQMYELQRISSEQDFSFNWYVNGFLGYQKTLPLNRARLLSTIENHDFGKPILNHDMQQVTYALAGFTGHHPSLFFHGTETPGRITHNRDLLADVREESELLQMSQSIDRALRDYRQESMPSSEIKVHFSDEQSREVGLYSIESKMNALYLLVAKPNSSQRIINLPLDKSHIELNLQLKYQNGNVSIAQKEESLVIEINGFAILLFEISK
ncbi:MAG: hypothetical protein KDD40_01335 [Bdellovibrionales bacterium]|nr:hypothetical protein [Bdellovibrionales bacterium]